MQEMKEIISHISSSLKVNLWLTVTFIKKMGWAKTLMLKTSMCHCFFPNKLDHSHVDYTFVSKKKKKIIWILEPQDLIVLILGFVVTDTRPLLYFLIKDCMHLDEQDFVSVEGGRGSFILSLLLYMINVILWLFFFVF